MKEGDYWQITQSNDGMQKIELMEKCYDGFVDLGLHGTGIRVLEKHCGYNKSITILRVILFIIFFIERW